MEVSPQANDVIMRSLTQIFQEKTLKAFGVDTPPIAGLFPTDVPVVEVRDRRTDFIFVLSDNSLLYVEYQKTVSIEHLKRFMFYAARLALRDKDNRGIRTVVIYFGEIEKAPEELHRGCLTYKVTNVYMHSFDGDEQYAWLKEKVEKDGWLEDEDLLRLCFLPLMKSNLNEAEMTMRAAELAEVIPGETGAFVQGVLLALSDRVVAANDFANQ